MSERLRCYLQQPVSRRDALSILGNVALITAAGVALGGSGRIDKGFDRLVELADFVPLQKLRARFREVTGVELPAYTGLGFKLDGIFATGVRTPSAEQDARYLATAWATRIPELQTTSRSIDMSGLPPENQQIALAFLEEMYRLFPVLNVTSPPKILIQSDTDWYCGAPTIGCTDGSVMAIDYLSDRRSTVFVFLHEQAHELDWDMDNIVPYVHREHAVQHVGDMFQFFHDLVNEVQTAHPFDLMDCGLFYFAYPEARIDEDGKPVGSMSRAFYPCLDLLQPFLGPNDIPAEVSSERHPKTFFHRMRLPLFRKALQMAANGTLIDGVPAREHPAVQAYLDAGFRYFHHIMSDPQLAKQPDPFTQENPFSNRLFEWKTRISMSRLQMWSLGKIPASTPIADVWRLLKLS
ncbi:MAG: hypothetical protein N2691_02645 [Patescibacteria group bacterium]|nr:hypothetical protein [Patescibacteria group bacterium]